MPKTTAAPTAVIDHLTFSFDDGTPVFDGLSLTFPSGFTVLMGPNGLGKSVLLRLIAGQLTPTTGHISVPSPPAVLPQDLTLQADTTVADLLGISPVLTAIDELSATDPAPEPDRVTELLETIGDQWDVEDSACADLAAHGPVSLPAEPATLRRAVSSLSGGEAMLVALVGLRRRSPELTLLDEPSNNLDAGARARLVESLTDWPGSVIVVTHDRALLRAAEHLVELKPARVRRGRPEGVVSETFGGWEARERVLADRQANAQRRLTRAQSDLRQEKQAREAEQARATRSAAQGRKAAENAPKILANTLKKKAAANVADARATRNARVESAASEVEAALDALKELTTIDVDLPGTRVSAATVVLSTAVPELITGRLVADDGVPLPIGAPLTVRGPERIALRGSNGAGKSTLLDLMLCDARVPLGVLSQRTGSTAGEELNPDRSALENLLARVPDLTAGHAREVLARLALRGERVHQSYGSLSGGERFRVDLARVLAATPAPQLLVLDEPTNDLDLDSVQALASALKGFGGALILVSHDADFLTDVGVTRTWELVEPDPAPEAAAV
ncbi:MAG: ATP-binding cassette domain-containing protein [Galactobacter sp.]